MFVFRLFILSLCLTLWLSPSTVYEIAIKCFWAIVLFAQEQFRTLSLSLPPLIFSHFSLDHYLGLWLKSAVWEYSLLLYPPMSVIPFSSNVFFRVFSLPLGCSLHWLSFRGVILAREGEKENKRKSNTPRNCLRGAIAVNWLDKRRCGRLDKWVSLRGRVSLQWGEWKRIFCKFQTDQKAEVAACHDVSS